MSSGQSVSFLLLFTEVASMQVSPNIERFNKLTAEILTALYSSFPVPLTISCGMFGTDKEFCASEQGDEGLKFFMATGRWLTESGYIRHARENTILFFDAVLTPKGMEVLCAIPDSLSAREPLGERLATALQTGSKTVLMEAMKAVFAAGARHLLP